jgi:hypothetical protein
MPFPDSRGAVPFPDSRGAVPFPVSHGRAAVLLPVSHGRAAVLLPASHGGAGVPFLDSHGGVPLVASQGGVPLVASHGGVPSVKRCQVAPPVGPLWPAEPSAGCCQARPLSRISPGSASVPGSEPGVGQAVPEMASCWRAGGSLGGRRFSAPAPVCHASVVDRQPCVPEADRHSVVCRQRAVCSVARHSAVSVRQPTPSAGKLGRPVGSTEDQRLTSTWPSPLAGRCAQASARSAHSTASGIGCKLPVSATEPVPQEPDFSGLSGLEEADLSSGARLSRGRRDP